MKPIKLTNKKIGLLFKSGKSMHEIASMMDGHYVSGVPVPDLQTLFKVERIIRTILIKQSYD